MESSLQKIEQLQMLLLRYNIQLLPQGLEQQQKKKKELIQIFKEDQDFNHNLQKEVNKFQAIDFQLFKQVLGYERSFQIKKEYDSNIEEQNNFQENILMAQNKIKDKQKDILIFQGFIHNHFIREKDRVQQLEDAFVQLNQLKEQAISEISMLDKQLIGEAKAYKNPPPVLQKVFDMIDILLNKSSAQSNTRTNHKLLLANPNEFIIKINSFKMENISQNQITVARNLFESLNSDQCNQCSNFAYIMYNWGQFQFQIADILYTNQIEELTKHKQTLKYQENTYDFKQQIIDFEKTVSDNQIQKHLLLFDKDSYNKAIQVVQTANLFDQLQIIIKPKQYGIKITNYIIQFLQQQQYPETQIDVLIDKIISNMFPNYTILLDQTLEQPENHPIKLHNLTISNTNFNIIAHDIVVLLKNPIQLYNNLKQLNCLIDQAAQTQDLHSLVNQIYLNFQTYQEELLQEILKFIHQTIIMIPNETEITLHQILKIIHANQTERKIFMGIIDHIQKLSNLNQQYQTQIQFQGMPLIDYLIKTYLDDNQCNLKLNQQQQKAIKNIILNQKLNIDETLENINENYQIVQQCKEYYGEVNQQIQCINNYIQDNKKYIEGEQDYIKQTNQIFNKLKIKFFDLLTEIKYLEDELKRLKYKDSQLLYQIDEQKKILNTPIYHGIKIKQLGFLKYLNKLNPISYFASKIALIQLGIYSFTPDMIKKHLGSHSGLKKLEKVTINHLNDSQFLHLSKLLMMFNDEIPLSKFDNKAIQNLIQTTFRIFGLKQLKIMNNKLMVLRSDLLQKYRVTKKKLHLIYNLKTDLDLQILSQQEEIIIQIKKNFELLRIQDNQNQQTLDQLNDMQQLQQLIKQLQLLDTTDLCIQLCLQNFANEQKQEIQITKLEESQIFYLIQLRYQIIPKGLLNVQNKFNLLLMYLQDQYINNKVELLSIYENKGFFESFKMPLLIDALSYQIYYNKIAMPNVNYIIGISSYQLFYNQFGDQIQAICIQPGHNLTNNHININYQIRVLYEILFTKFGSATLAVILQFLKQVSVIKSQLLSIYDILNYQIILDAQNDIQFQEFQLEVQEIIKCQIKLFFI